MKASGFILALTYWLLAAPLHSQDAPPSADETLEFPDLIASGKSNTTVGTFRAARYDFVLCAGRDSPDPPPGRQIDEIEPGVSAGAYNNRITAAVIRGIDATDAGSAARRSVLTVAEDAYVLALKKDPQFFPFLHNLGRVKLLLNLPEQALSYLALARSRLPEFAIGYLLMGRAHARLNDGLSAVENFRTAYRKNPFDPTALVALGDFYLESGAFPQSRDAYERILKQFPDNAQARIGLGRLHMQKAEFFRARSYFESVRTQNIDGSWRDDYDRALHFYLAEVCTNLKDYKEALRQYDRMLEHPEDPFFLDHSLALLKKRREVVQKLAAEQR
ncbi:MAG: tetratricopeptide repeat protein [Leptospirales bacterium]|nr:tetratricopeptide repeat protein [Leptospirales bacterium]